MQTQTGGDLILRSCIYNYYSLFKNALDEMQFESFAATNFKNYIKPS